MQNEIRNTHANKAASYDIGRPGYPEEFFDYLYGEFGLTNRSVIADIGAGTGKITKRFLERGTKVFAIEPDKNMMSFLKTNLAGYTNCTFIESSAESTGIASNSLDLIFCGNSYIWFNRNDVVPEFQRVVRYSDNHNVVIAHMSPDDRHISMNYLKPKRSSSGLLCA